MSGDVLDSLTQMAFLASVLAGFAITAAIELVSIGRKGALSSIAISFFIFSGVISLAGTFIFVAAYNGVIGLGFPKVSDSWLSHFTGGMGMLPFLGLISFLAGISLVGWLRSKVIGIISTLSVLLALTLIIYVLINMGA
jgi:hypothetical protein